MNDFINAMNDAGRRYYEKRNPPADPLENLLAKYAKEQNASWAEELDERAKRQVRLDIADFISANLDSPRKLVNKK